MATLQQISTGEESKGVRRATIHLERVGVDMVVIAELVHCAHRLMHQRLRSGFPQLLEGQTARALPILDVDQTCALTVEQGKPKDE